jgi:hypothetical protein
MVAAMTPRLRVVLVAVAVLAAVSGLLGAGVAHADSVGSPHGTTSAALADAPGAPVAAPAALHRVRSVTRDLAQPAPAVLAFAWIFLAGPRRVAGGRQLPLGDVGDSWRALLLGAPPGLG